MSDDPAREVWNADVANNDGYLYSTNPSLSNCLANDRITHAILGITDFANKRVVDIGCGDGVFSAELVAKGHASSVLGVDAATAAVAAARRRFSGDSLSFEVGDANQLAYPARSFDLAVFRGVLHHSDHPVDMLREGLRIADEVVVLEPNGYNPGLKLLERVSRYHVEHHEKSYAPRTVDRWLRELGASVVASGWAGFVPMFCPDWFARLTKRLESAVEHAPVVRRTACAVYVCAASRS